MKSPCPPSVEFLLLLLLPFLGMSIVSTFPADCLPGGDPFLCPHGQPSAEAIAPSRQPPSLSRAGRVGGPKLVLPLPDPHENIGEPIPEFSDIDDSEQLSNLLPSGSPCTSDNQCQVGLRCEPSPAVPLFAFHPPLASNESSKSSGTGLHGSSALVPSLALRVCSQVDCSGGCAKSTSFESLSCPKDSYIIEQDNLDESCCIQTCKCLPDMCKKPFKANCSSLYEFLPGKGVPGRCCDQAECIKDVEQSVRSHAKHNCSWNDIEYKHGSSWYGADCHHCSCNMGVSVCGQVDNCPLPLGCSPSGNVTLDRLEPHQCCRKCKGCQEPGARMRAHGETWSLENNCGECTCTDEKLRCHTNACHPLSCPEPNTVLEQVPGTCCPRCICALDCTLHGGFKKSRDEDGSTLELCQCAIEEEDTDGEEDPETREPGSTATSKSTASWDQQVAITPTPHCSDDEATCQKESFHASFPWLALIIGTLIAVLVFVLVGVAIRMYNRRPKPETNQQVTYSRVAQTEGTKATEERTLANGHLPSEPSPL